MISTNPLMIYSTLSRRKEAFKPVHEGRVGMYVCGVTVYDYCHIGHGRTFVAFDVIRRWLEARGYQVTFVRNVTDVDDKIIRRAAERGISTLELTREFTAAMQQDMASLGCLPPTYEPHATDFIPQMLDLIRALQDKGLAYVGSDGDVDFAVRSFPGYGKLSGKSLDDLQAGARIGIGQGKRDPLDFVLWKKAKPGEPHWTSPWGEGRPGWHIECSAMSCHYLGKTFDIHGGGPDLIFPHHENEIAQSEGANGVRFANYWMHSGPLRVRAADGTEQKMSKSLHNFWTIRDALSETDGKFGAGNGAEVLRFFLLRTHYRSPISFNTGLIVDAHKALTRLYEALDGAKGDGLPLDWEEKHAAAFARAMDDYFNTPVAIAQLFDLATEVNRSKDPALVRQLKGLGGVLNILQRDPAAFLKGAVKGLDEEEINRLIKARRDCKKSRNFARADEIRTQCLEQGIVLLDTPQGTTWRRS